MIVVALLLQVSAVEVTAESRRLYEPYRQCLSGQTALLAGPEGETSGLDRARTNCMAQNLSAGSNALFAEVRGGLTQDQAVERLGALRTEIEREMLARAGAAPPATTTRAVARASVEIPDEIAPAIVPYVRCLMASRGVPIRGPGGGAEEAPAAERGADCTPVRREAARRADAMLVAQRRGTREERAALIERTLAGVESFADASALPTPERRSDASN
jgi:hypothetical protein